MNIKKSLKRIICLLAVVMLFTTAGTFTYWSEYFGAKTNLDLDFTVGEFGDDDTSNPLENIPSFVPQYIVNTLNTLDPVKEREIMVALINTVIRVYEYGNFTGTIHLDATADDLFAQTPAPNINPNDYLLFTVGTGAEMEVFFVHITSSYNGFINSPNDIFNAIENSWTGVNQISAFWIRGNLYTSFHAPIECEDGFYLSLNDGNRYVPPSQTVSQGTWFYIDPNLEFFPQNTVYPQGHIIRYQGEYYIAGGAIWGSSPSVSWANWNRISFHNGNQGVSTSNGATVYTQNGENIRFWTALRNTTSAPSEQSARNGDWREVKNGWIGRRGDMTTKNYYYPHNTYSTGDIAIFGTSAYLRYRYYRAIRAVPADQPPLIRESENDVFELNSHYWEAWT